ncbi:rsmC [Symbiodinium natans]|uniref:RsmC protein n=1 Tax=Symbiodinium natans TaxID=878477 RepID=A0A812JAF6_9DINO|nr:rsmC [Symbiodinium natans]
MLHLNCGCKFRGTEERLEGNAFFVCSAEDGMPDPQHMALCWLCCGLDDRTRPIACLAPQQEEREEKEAEEMKQYQAGSSLGLSGGLPPEKKTVEKGQLLAKTLPPDALLWGRALMQRFKENGGSVSYNLKVDRERKATRPNSGRIMSNRRICHSATCCSCRHIRLRIRVCTTDPN